MKPKILLVCTVLPTGKIGASLRTLQTASILADIGNLNVVLASEHAIDPAELQRSRERFRFIDEIPFQKAPGISLQSRLRELFDSKYINTHSIAADAKGQKRLRQLRSEHDVTWLHTLKVPNAFRQFEWDNTVLDIDDIPSPWIHSAADFEPRLASRLRLRLKAILQSRRERWCLQRFSALTVCTKEDLGHFGNSDQVFVVPNGFEMLPVNERERATDHPKLGMIGAYSYLPNKDGLVWFIKHVWPKVKAAHPTVTLELIGRDGAAVAAPFRDARIKALDFVPDVATEVSRWSAMIVPTRIGGGTHLKVAEGMARSLPIVATTRGRRGYDVTDRNELLIADTPADFAEACLDLINDDDLNAAIARNGRCYFESHLTWQAITPAVSAAVECALRCGHRFSLPSAVCQKT